jgi:putative hemolysin
MDSNAIIPALVALGVLITCSAFFSGSETALFSLSRGTRERMARSTKTRERAVAGLLAEPKKLIATLLIGNELVNITFSAVAASMVERLLDDDWNALGVALITTAVTVPVLLCFGEVLPKSVGLATGETWARVASAPLRGFMFLVTPVRWVVSGLTGGIARLFGQHDGGPRRVGEAEFKALVDVGSEAGELHAAERRLIHNVFEFGDRTVAEIMTPAKSVFALAGDMPLGRVVVEVARSGFSRVPIHRGRRQEIVGVVFAKDLVGWSSGRLAQKSLSELLRPSSYVPKTSKCAQVFAEFQRTRTHLAIVVDEYGRQVGLVTMEDLLGELFGDVSDDSRTPKPPSPSPSASADGAEEAAP